jgi:hypothetical protein
MENLTIEQALEVIGQALANDSLKLSQKEHIIIFESFKKIKEELTPKPDENK